MFCLKLKEYHDTYEMPKQWVINNYGEETMQRILDQPESVFLDMDREVPVTLDTRQVMKIRWVTQLNPHKARSRNPIKAYFLGMYKDRNGKRLEEKYVHDMFTSEFVRNVVERGNAGDCRFVDIPPGRPRMTPLQTKES